RRGGRRHAAQPRIPRHGAISLVAFLEGHVASAVPQRHAVGLEWPPQCGQRRGKPVFNPKTSMFICDNFVASGRNAVNGAGRCTRVDQVADTEYYECVDKKGRQLDIYEIREPAQGGTGDIFMGYWCPYEIDKTRYVTLTGAADYMFTATMDGCSFG